MKKNPRLIRDLFLVLILLACGAVLAGNIQSGVEFGKKFLVFRGTNYTEFVGAGVPSDKIFYYLGWLMDEANLESDRVLIPDDAQAYRLALKRLPKRLWNRLEKVKGKARGYLAYAAYPRNIEFESYPWRISNRRQNRIVEKYAEYSHRVGGYTFVILADMCLEGEACYLYFNRQFLMIGPAIF